MAKLIFVAVVFGLFALIFIVKKLASGTRQAWTQANAMANARLDGKNQSLKYQSALPSAGSRTQAQDRALRVFMDGQSLLLNIDGKGLFLDSELEKQLYVHFVAGAVDCLSRSIEDEKEAEKWFLLSAYAYAFVVCGDREAHTILESYGRSGDARLEEAAKVGWWSMKMYVDSSSGDVPEEDFRQMMMNLYAVVKQKELPSPPR